LIYLKLMAGEQPVHVAVRYGSRLMGSVLLKAGQARTVRFRLESSQLSKLAMDGATSLISLEHLALPPSDSEHEAGSTATLPSTPWRGVGLVEFALCAESDITFRLDLREREQMTVLEP
jgi:hypothetical protein